MLATQIYLPEKLRKEIDCLRAETGESLSAFFRRAIREKLQKDRQKTNPSRN